MAVFTKFELEGSGMEAYCLMTVRLASNKKKMPIGTNQSINFDFWRRRIKKPVMATNLISKTHLSETIVIFELFKPNLASKLVNSANKT
jgi:hypothetical protein